MLGYKLDCRPGHMVAQQRGAKPMDVTATATPKVPFGADNKAKH